MNVHSPIGKSSFSVEQLTENFGTLMLSVIRARPASAKGQFIRKISVSSTMGPSVDIDPSQAQALAESLGVERTAGQLGEQAQLHRAQQGLRGPESQAGLHD